METPYLLPCFYTFLKTFVIHTSNIIFIKNIYLFFSFFFKDFSLNLFSHLSLEGRRRLKAGRGGILKTLTKLGILFDGWSGRVTGGTGGTGKGVSTESGRLTVDGRGNWWCGRFCNHEHTLTHTHPYSKCIPCLLYCILLFVLFVLFVLAICV